MFTSISKYLEQYYERHDNIVVFGDFNSSGSDPFFDEFMINFDLTNLIKVPTCYNYSENPSAIDLILTNRIHSFQNTTALEQSKRELFTKIWKQD